MGRDDRQTDRWKVRQPDRWINRNRYIRTEMDRDRELEIMEKMENRSVDSDS